MMMMMTMMMMMMMMMMIPIPFFEFPMNLGNQWMISHFF